MGRPQSKTGVQNSSIRARNEIFEKISKMTSFGITKIAKLCSIITHRHRVGLSLDLVDFSCVDPRWSVPILRSVRAGADSESENCRFALFLVLPGSVGGPGFLPLWRAQIARASGSSKTCIFSRTGVFRAVDD